MKIKNVLVPLLLTVFVVGCAGQGSNNGGSENNTAAAQSESDTRISHGEYSGIVYVNSDTILAKYTMAVELLRDFNIKAEKAQREFGTKSRALETRVMDYQNKATKGLITRTEAMTLEESLQKEAAELDRYGKQMEQTLSEEQYVMMNKISNSITEYIKEYNIDKKYSMILSTNAMTSLVIAADPELDITGVIVDGLNKEYAKTQKK